MCLKRLTMKVTATQKTNLFDNFIFHMYISDEIFPLFSSGDHILQLLLCTGLCIDTGVSHNFLEEIGLY